MTNHKYRIIFQYRTKVVKSSDDVHIQYFGFDFVNLRSIRCGLVDSTLLIDVIGLMRNISNIRRNFSDNFQTDRIPIEIYDAWYKINVEVIDYTGWARFIILDPDATNFLMTDASKLLRRELSDDPLKHTNVLGNLVDKVFLFKIFVNEASCVPTPSFEVITMSWDTSLIQKLSNNVC
ncbi:replication protein A 70 kDa DNA-binding subunit A [Senna tora]|uniref:Replication protein A 70 kDa DNA-binding subunit A n=1 Tax=Senna tora TaxID=362788 RepID=A0A834XFJ5_9FABA|nr:replication protein A 70 kDa DNA-binding subunit A [Senna tora]